MHAEPTRWQRVVLEPANHRPNAFRNLTLLRFPWSCFKVPVYYGDDGCFKLNPTYSIVAIEAMFLPIQYPSFAVR